MKLDHKTTDIDAPLKRYLHSPDGSAEQDKARTQLIRLIDHPQRLRSSAQLSELYPLFHHSYIVSDAFEAVTNGMYNPEALEKLEDIEEDSPLHPWKTAICAILAFYQGDRENMMELLKKLPPDTPPAAIAGPLRHLAGNRSLQDPGEKQQQLIDAVSADRSFIHSAATQLREYLSEDIEDSFAETSLLLIRELLPNHPLAGKRLALWSMQTAAERGYSLSLYPSQLEQMFGAPEGMRLAALALHATDPDIALLFLIRSLLQHMREDDLQPAELAAYFSVIAEWAEELLSHAVDEERGSGETQELQEAEEYIQGLGALTAKLRSEIRKRYFRHGKELDDYFSPITSPLLWLQDNGRRIGNLYRSYAEARESVYAAHRNPTDSRSPRSGEREESRSAISSYGDTLSASGGEQSEGPRQLELF